jgi:hypothetical protein
VNDRRSFISTDCMRLATLCCRNLAELLRVPLLLAVGIAKFDGRDQVFAEVGTDVLDEARQLARVEGAPDQPRAGVPGADQRDPVAEPEQSSAARRAGGRSGR